MKHFSKHLIIIIVSFILNGHLNGQDYTAFEKQIFDKIQSDSIDNYDLLNTINYDQSLYMKGKEELKDHIAILKSKGIQIKPLKKQIKAIYKTTHKRFFKKYEAEVFFNDIFKNGSYNCVTASALYGLIFDEFGINYSIRETPSHIYLIADTTGLQTLIESTMPGSGVVSFNDKFKKDFVNYLYVNKLITETEYESNSTDFLFGKHYSKDKSISFKQLCGIQYFNKGIFLTEEEKFFGAVQNFKKASEIYPADNIKYHLYASITNALANDYSKKKFNGKHFGTLIKSSSQDSSLTQVITDYFQSISHRLCIEAPDLDRYDKFYSDITSICKEEDIAKEIPYKYYYFKAYNKGINGDYPLALKNISKAHEVDTNNLEVKKLAIELSIKHLLIENNYRNQIDSLEFYFSELPFLSSNKIFQQHLVYYYAKVITQYFEYEENKNALEYYDRFIESFDTYQIKHFASEHLNMIFGITSIYFAANENYKKAYEIMDFGLKIDPASLGLKHLKEEINLARKREKEYKKYSSQTNYKHIPIISTKEQQNQTLKEDVDKFFPGKWKAVAIIIEDMEQKLNKTEVFEFKSDKNKNCSYIENGKKELGKWAYRKKSKCIYFVPHLNKDDYKVFKVKEISKDKLLLLPYKDQKKPSPYQYVLKRIE